MKVEGTEGGEVVGERTERGRGVQEGAGNGVQGGSTKGGGEVRVVCETRA